MVMVLTHNLFFNVRLTLFIDDLLIVTRVTYIGQKVIDKISNNCINYHLSSFHAVYIIIKYNSHLIRCEAMLLYANIVATRCFFCFFFKK